MAEEKKVVKKKTKRKKTAKQKALGRLRWLRILVQIGFFIYSPALFSQSFAALKTLFVTLGNGGALSVSTFLIRLLTICLLTVFMGRIFCGWACAFGALNDWVYQLAQAIFKLFKIKTPQIPEEAFPWLQKIKYLVLIEILVLCFAGEGSMITDVSAWTVFSLITAHNFTPGAYPAALMSLIFLICGMAVQERFFCQFFCPLGAIFSLIPEFPLLSLRRRQESCIKNCALCKKNCPVSLKFAETPDREGECIRCGRCMINCPKKNVAPWVWQKLRRKPETSGKTK